MGRRRTYKSYFKFKLKPKTVMTISALGGLAVSALLLISFFSPSSILLALNEKVVAIVGWCGFFLPFILGSLSLIPFRGQRKKKKNFTHVPLGGGLLLLALLGLTASFTPQRSGLLGRELWFNLSDLLTSLGALVFLLAAALVGATVLFNTSLDELLGKVGTIVSFLKRFWGRFVVRGILARRKRLVLNKKEPLRVKGLPDAALGDQQALALKTAGGSEPKTGVIPPKEGLGDLQPSLVSNLPTEEKIWKYPSLSLLSDGPAQTADRGDIEKNAATIEKTLESFAIPAQVVEVNLGPAVTQYALEIAMGTKLSKITSLANDLALALAAPTGQIRIEAPIPGRSLVGIEVPNRSLEFVTLKSILGSEAMRKTKSKLVVGLGLDVSGNPIVADIARMPHVLIAGATGSGKTVCLNSFITSVLFRATPYEVKLIVIDPKRVEMSFYGGIPHLLTPVIVDIDKTLSALKWAIAEMERRYKLFANAGARNITSYNEMSGFQALPCVLIIIDELADLMAFAPVEFEDAITRLAQMSRATGIHLIIATQRPSVDVITGLIKANIPCRIAFNVSAMVDSRVILDSPGAEKLLGRGDMLYIPPDQAKPTRIQGTFVSDAEVKRLVGFLKESGGQPQYAEEITTVFTGKIGQDASMTDRDELFENAVRVVCEYDRASASLLQRRLRIGYARAARILDQLETAGVVGPPEGSKPRDVFIRNAEAVLVSDSSGNT